MNQEELRLPQHLIDKAILSTNEYGWRQADVLDVIEAAQQIPIAVIGGQVQYILPEGTYELYWLSYDSSPRQADEEWTDYCNRAANECGLKFKQLINTTDIDAEAVKVFEGLKEITRRGGQLKQYQFFILHFDDLETDVHC